MRNFYLAAKEVNEVVNLAKFDTLEEAVEYFAGVKKLTIDNLLALFDVVDSDIREFVK